MKTMIVALALMAGCGGTEPASGGGLAGTWLLDVNASCTAGMTFTGTGYAQQLLCNTADGGFGNDVEGGEFSTSGDRINFTPRRASCPTANHDPWTARYLIKGNVLTLADDTQAVTYVKFTPGASQGGAVQYGCWTMGAFTPSPISPL